MVEFKEIASRAELDEELANSGDKLVFLKFQGEWCMPCKSYRHSFEMLPEEYAGKVRVLEADIDKLEDMAGEFGVRGIPATFIYYKSELKDQFAGFRTDRQIIEKIKEVSA